MDNLDRINTAAKLYDSSLVLKNEQIESLRFFLEGKDILVNLPTGFGKSLVFHLIPYLTSKSVLVICPLNIIQSDQLKTLSQHGLSACRLTQECQVLTADDTPASLKDVMHGNFQVIFCHPEALFSTDRGSLLLDSPAFQSSVAAVVVDECHKVEEW